MRGEKNKILGFCLALVMALSCLPVSDAMAKNKHKHKHYKYIYYPSSQVYYSPVQQRYYYMNSGVWTYAPRAPVTVNLGKGVSVNLGGSTPYVYHPTVISQYPVVVVP